MFPNSLIGIMFTRDYIQDIERTRTNITNINIKNSLEKYTQWLLISTQISVLESDLIEKKENFDGLTRDDIQNIVETGYLYPYRNSDANGLYYISHEKVIQLLFYFIIYSLTHFFVYSNRLDF